MRLMLLAGPGNSVGRAYCLWLIAQELGWPCTPVVADSWAPLAETEFSRHCAPYEAMSSLLDEDFDAIIAYQPFPETLGVALTHAAAVQGRIFVDIDELGWEQRYGYTPRHRLRVAAAMLVHGRNPWPYQQLRIATSLLPVLLSNPCLRRYYTGSVVPHVRLPRSSAPWPESDVLRVAFVGTVRSAKGIDVVRSAVDAVDGVHLTVTGERPEDATLAETWTGPVPIEEGLRILEESQVIAVMSHDTEWTRHQFPVKLIDGMLAGRAIVASDLPPIRWAVGGTALLVPPGDTARLAAALQHLRDHPSEARELGDAARARALELFTPARAAPAFEEIISRAH